MLICPHCDEHFRDDGRDPSSLRCTECGSSLVRETAHAGGDDDRPTGAIAGAIIGGLAAGTILGAIIGGIAGLFIGNERNKHKDEDEDEE